MIFRRSRARELTPLAAVFGASWIPRPGAEPGREDQAAGEAARDNGGSWYVVVEADGEAMVGFVSSRLGPGMRLAGQLLASAVTAKEVCTLAALDQPVPNPFRAKTLLFLGRYDKGNHAAVAVLNGAPAFELVAPLTDVIAKAQDFAGRLHGGGLLLIEEEAVEDFAEIRQAAPAAFRSVAGLPFDAQWESKTVAPRAVGFSRMRATIAVALISVVALPVGRWGYNKYAAVRMQRVAQEQAAAARVTAVREFERLQLEAMTHAGLAQAAPAAHMAFDFVRKLLDERAGFNVEKLVVSPKETSVTYTRQKKTSTFEDFVSASDECVPSFDVKKLDAASAACPVLPWEKAEKVNSSAAIDSANVLLELGSLAQRSALIGVQVALTPPSPVLTQEQQDRIEATTVAKIGRRMGSWSATGPMDLFVPLCEALPAQSCTLSDVEFKLSRGTNGVPADTFTASGKFVVGWA